MQRTFLLGFLSMAALASNGLLARERDTLSQNRTLAILTASSSDKVTEARPGANPASRWRYQYYHGQWWYYRPSRQWSYWNGNAWTDYKPQTYPSFGRQRRPDADNYAHRNDGYGFRPFGTIQREKNEPRSAGPEWLESRQAGTIQREKNESRSLYFGPFDVRPPGTIQNEKNNPRAR
jgi:hypothetical protein